MLQSSFQRGLRPNQWTRLVVPRALHIVCQLFTSRKCSSRSHVVVCSALHVPHFWQSVVLLCRRIESAKEVGGNKCVQRRHSSSHRFLLALVLAVPHRFAYHRSHQTIQSESEALPRLGNYLVIHVAVIADGRLIRTSEDAPVHLTCK